MSEKTPEAGSPEAPSAPVTPEEKPRPEHVERAPARAEASKDYDPHFAEVVKHLMDMPEKLINALREAIPPAQEASQEEAVHGHEPEAEAEEQPIPPGGKQHISAKRGFAHRWLGK